MFIESDNNFYEHLFLFLVNSSLDEIVTVDLWSDVVKSQEPRYSLTVVDTAMSKLSSNNGKFAIFIVPQGRSYAPFLDNSYLIKIQFLIYTKYNFV